MPVRDVLLGLVVGVVWGVNFVVTDEGLDGPSEVGHALTHLSRGNLLSTAHTAYLASLVGYGIWSSLLARHPAASVVPFALLVPPVAMFAAWAVQGTVPNLAETLGGAVLLVGVAVTSLSWRRRRATAAAER